MRKGRNLMQKKLPIGIENFEDMIKENYYYVDKTKKPRTVKNSRP